MAAARSKDRQDTKRAKHESGRTLDHFFSKKTDTTKPSTSSNNQGISNTTKITTSKAHLNNKPPFSNSEVIIIDSDDELDIPTIPVGSRKRRLSTSSDVEIVDMTSTVTKHVSAVGAAARRATFDSALPSTSGAVASNNTSSTFSFGKPCLLSDAVSESRSGFAFGVAGNLLNPDSKSIAAPPERCFESGVKEETTQVDVDLTEGGSEEWLMGDDEMGNGTYKEDDGDEVEFVEDMLITNDDSHFSIEVCPCCERKLQPSEAQAHVNDCPDSEKKVQAPGPLITSETPAISKCDAGSATSNNAFSVLMSSFKENEAWKEASAVEDKSFRPVKANGGRRKAPFYKVLQGMPIAVDAFRYGTIPEVTAYFLTHAHSDHYTNLSSNWKSGPIYCSQGTANLIIHMLSVDKKWVRPLPMDTPTVIPDTGGVQVTLIEANHCPGSCIFLFEGQQTINAGDSNFRSAFIGSSRVFRYLHCGDFRASPRHVVHPAVRGKKIDHVYLDTTYLDPRYTFPPQPLVISACAELSRRLIAGEPTTTNNTMKSWLPSLPSLKSTAEISNKKGRTLVVVGTYSIGKERIVKAVAHILGSKVYCDARKTSILRCEGDTELESMLTSDPLEATVHLVPLGTIATDRLKIYLDRFKGAFTKAVGFRPTGWTYSQPSGTDQVPSIASILARTSQKDFTYADLHQSPKSTSSIQVYGVPYSEHSSFYELTCFAMSFNWIKMIATVNVGSENSRGKMTKWVERWETERKKRGIDVLVTPRHEDYW